MIQTEEIKLSRVKTNKENPRTITRDKFDKLVNSILVFPKMLQLRPIVVDGKMTALGGNMRNEALKDIAKMKPEEIAQRLAGLADFVKKTKGERDALIEYWGKWLENPTALIIRADSLSEQEREQFIVKDNVSFGTWNYDALTSKWDSSLLNDWGMDVWQAAPAAFQPATASTGYVPSAPDESEVDENINPDAFGEEFSLPDGDKKPFQQMTFTFSNMEAELIKSCINAVKRMDNDSKNQDYGGNENVNGNALYLIVKQWAEQRK